MEHGQVDHARSGRHPRRSTARSTSTHPPRSPSGRAPPKAAITLAAAARDAFRPALRRGLRRRRRCRNCIEMLFGDSGPSHAEYAAALPLEHEPGTVWNYSSGTTNIVARIIGDIVHGATRRRRPTRGRRRCGRSSRPAVRPGRHDLGRTEVRRRRRLRRVVVRVRDRARLRAVRRAVPPRRCCRLGPGERILPAGGPITPRTEVAHDPENGFDYGRHWWMWPAFPGSLAATATKVSTSSSFPIASSCSSTSARPTSLSRRCSITDSAT